MELESFERLEGLTPTAHVRQKAELLYVETLPQKMRCSVTQPHTNMRNSNNTKRSSECSTCSRQD
eukprot:6294632-Prorocentrum_lima.AAC.1